MGIELKADSIGKRTTKNVSTARSHLKPRKPEADRTVPEEWYRALSLDERVSAKFQPTRHDNPGRVENGREQFAKWLATPVFKAKSGRLSDRLAISGLDDSSLVDLLSESTSDLAARQPRIPSSLLKACFAVEGFGTGSVNLPEGFFASGIERFPAACLRLATPFLSSPVASLEAGLRKIFAEHSTLPSDRQNMKQMLLASLAERIYPVFLRTIALEVAVARITEQLDAPTTEGRFDQFIDQLVQPERLKAFYREYPVLARQLVLIIDFWLDEALEIVSRLALDWPIILRERLLDNACGQLTKLESGTGDGHKQGRSVIKLGFESGSQLIYKPRSLALDKHFEQLLFWLNSRLESDSPHFPEFLAAQVLDRGKYGWSKFVQTIDCASVQQLDRFYLRQGGYLALMYLLEATDFHSENMIAAGEHPVMVDLEALFQPRIGYSNDLADPAELAWLDSVMRTGLLPERTNPHGDNPGYDISGLGHRPGERLARPEAIMIGLATDEMHVTAETGEIPVNPNAPTLNGKRIDPTSMLGKVCVGFETVLKLIIRYRDEFIVGPLSAFSKDETRVILWPTQIYDNAMRISFHPDYLRDALDRERVYNRLWRSGKTRNWDQIVQSERLDLLNRDIPFFTAIAGGCDVFDSRGKKFSSVIDQSGFERALGRVRDLNEEVLRQQEWFIKASFATIPIDEGGLNWKASRLNPQASDITRGEILQEAMKIGDRVVELAFRDKNRVGWLGVGMVSDRHWAITPASIDLYDGCCGISLFLAYLGNVSGKKIYSKLARNGINGVLERIEEICKKETPQIVGAFGDIGGSMFVLTHLGVLWQDDSLLDHAEQVALLSRMQLDKSSNIDLLDGISGFVTALCGLLKVRSSAALRVLADFCAQRIISALNCSGRSFPLVSWPCQIRSYAPLTGLSHGAAGIAMALSRLAKLLDSPVYIEASQRLVDYERSVFSPERGNWPDFRCFSGEGEETGNIQDEYTSESLSWYTTWCHGAPGIGLARLSMLRDGSNDPQLEIEVMASIETTLKSGFGLNHSLCHGDFGNLELILAAGERVPRLQRERLLSMVVDSIRNDGLLTGLPLGIESPGLMTGIAGIGYGLLRQLEPTRVPSVLTLDSPTG